MCSVVFIIDDCYSRLLYIICFCLDGSLVDNINPVLCYTSRFKTITVSLWSYWHLYYHLQMVNQIHCIFCYNWKEVVNIRTIYTKPKKELKYPWGTQSFHSIYHTPLYSVGGKHLDVVFKRRAAWWPAFLTVLCVGLDQRFSCNTAQHAIHLLSFILSLCPLV